MSEQPRDHWQDFCALCDGPIVKDQPVYFDGTVLTHRMCCNEDNRSKD